MKIGVTSVILNIVLDPLLIFGLLGLPKLGVKGAAAASLISQVYAVGLYAYLVFLRSYPIRLPERLRFDFRIVKRILAIGLPSGVTYFLLAANMLITYRVVSAYGTPALASLGIGYRILQSIYIPVFALTGAMAAVVGQNFGAGQIGRILETLRAGLALSSGFMILGTLFCWVFTDALIGFFNNEPEVIRFGVIYLTIMSLGNIVVGAIMSFSSVFQGLGKTYPTLIAALADSLLFALLVFTLPAFFGWGIRAVWWIKIATAVAEMGLCGVWLRYELQRVRQAHLY